MNNDLSFLLRTCRANPAGRVFFPGVVMHKVTSVGASWVSHGEVTKCDVSRFPLFKIRKCALIPHSTILFSREKWDKRTYELWTTICHFYSAHVVLIPQAAFFNAYFGTQICVFHEFHAPSASKKSLLCFPNVLGPKLVRNCRFQPKTRGFFQNPMFLQNMRRGIPNITFHAFCCP